MSSKRRERSRPAGYRGAPEVQPRSQPRPRQSRPAQSRQRVPQTRILGLPVRVAAAIGGIVVVLVLAIGALAAFGGGGGANGASPSAMAGATQTDATTAAPSQWSFHGTNGTWTNVNADRLAEMLAAKDFTLVNVKIPYFAEIEKTDLFIPYDQIAAQVSKLPQDKAAKILVYCRSGVESGQAAETLVSLGYTNVWNLDGGMLAWQASGRQLLYTHKP